MTRSLRQNEQILAWAEEGLIAPDQLSILDADDPLVPDSAQWLRFLAGVATTAGIILLGVGVIFFFAWNWAEMHRFAKLGLALGALTGLAALAAWATPATILFRAAMLGCAILTGALLALIGQIYQTGADVWQLFAIWAVLIVPWAWLSGSATCWGLFWAVDNLALVAFFAQSRWQGLFAGLQGYQALLVIALANGVLLLVFELFSRRLLFQPGRAIQRLACLAWLSALGCGAAGAWWDADYRLVLPVFLLICAAMLYVYCQQRRDLPVLATALFWLIVVATSGLVQWAVDADEILLALNGVALFVLVSSGLSAIWLTRLARESQA